MDNFARLKRHRQIRRRLAGTAERPRVCVYRSNRGISAQVIDDARGQTLFGLSDSRLGPKRGLARTKTLGEAVAAAVTRQGIRAVVFDRAGFAYHGHVRQVAETLRQAGLLP